MFFGHFADYCYLMMRASRSSPCAVKRDRIALRISTQLILQNGQVDVI